MKLTRVEGRFADAGDGTTAEADGGMVASAFPQATEAGVEILAAGGNAIDAACAVGLALAVCEPQGSGLAGQVYGLVYVEGRTIAIDGSGRVPSLAHRSRVDPERLAVGYQGSTVPSLPATYAWMQRRWGRLDWRSVLAPAARLAREGYAITQLQHDLQVRELENFLSVPGRSGATYYLKNGDTPYAAGDTFRQPDLAAVLDVLARDGVEAFYQGEIAQAIDDDMRAHDGFLRADDLAFIPWPVERRPLARRYRGYLVKSMPPPASGRTLLLVLMMLGNLRSRFVAGDDPERYHFLAETFRKAFLQRKDRPFDPNTYPQLPDKRMLSRRFARELALSIADEMDVSLPLEEPVGTQVGETTHFSVMDADGGAAAVTQSVELVYGSKAAAAGLGFLYNNYMLALERDNPAHPYYLRPNAVPWSSSTPTIVFRKKAPWVVLGSPGSERIFSAVVQVLVNVIDRSLPISEAVRAPRIHCTIGGRVHYERERIDDAVVRHLERLRYAMKPRDPYAFYLGCVQAVLKRQSGAGFQGAADPRRDGTAAGPP